MTLSSTDHDPTTDEQPGPVPPISSRQLNRQLDAELTLVRTELQRADTKASTLLALTCALFAGGLAAVNSGHVNSPALELSCLALAMLAVTVKLLVNVVRPKLNGNFGFVRWARSRDAQHLIADLTGSLTAATPLDRAEELRWLSRALRRKYTAQVWAVPLLVTSIVTAAVAAGFGGWTK